MQRLNDSNFKYRKTICVLVSGLNYTVSLALCKANGMNFYSIVTVEDYNQLVAFGNMVYGPGALLKLGGQQASNGTWFVYTPDPTPLHPSAIPSTVNGPCLQYAYDLPNKTRTVPCSTGGQIFCEFV